MYVFLVILFGLIFGDLLGYLIHTLLHWQGSGELYRRHMTHHQKLYPIHTFISKKYRHPGKDSTTLIFAIIIAIGGILMFISLPIWIAAVWLFEFIALGLINNYLHDTFHISPHWLEKFEWFKRLRRLHYIHHLGDMKHNYGIFNFIFDRVFQTYIPK
jgi:sterol desaturase/sphingolipid hydroxylase (fatty acid hydroxylase superfamily)